MKNGINPLSILWTTVPKGEKALVTTSSGDVSIVDGPKRIFTALGTRVEFFERHIVEENDGGYLIDEQGKRDRVTGPKVIFIHPQGGCWQGDRLHLLAPNEVLVVSGPPDAINSDGKNSNSDGKPEIYRHKIFKGSAQSEVHVSFLDTVTHFVWTGSPSRDTDDKIPGALRFEKLRINPTQSYLSFPVRTSDNVPIILRITIFYGYGDITKLIERNDPLAVMYNKIISTFVAYVSTLTFDEFRDGPGERISGHELFKESSSCDNTSESLEYFKAFGIEIEQVILREWFSSDDQVQRILSQVAILTTKQVLSQAEHQQAMVAIQNKLIQAQESAKLDEQKLLDATAEGQREAAKRTALFEALKADLGAELAGQLLLINEASKAESLVISPEMLRIAGN